MSLKDVAAAFAHVKQADRAVGVLGFCYGGLISWLAATRGESLKMQPGCCVGYYAGGIGKFAAEEPVCPVLLHFGADDSHIGKDQIDAVRAAHPEVEIYVYEGVGHAFSIASRMRSVPCGVGKAGTRAFAGVSEEEFGVKALARRMGARLLCPSEAVRVDKRAFPRGLKPRQFTELIGAAEAAPFQWKRRLTHYLGLR